ISLLRTTDGACCLPPLATPPLPFSSPFFFLIIRPPPQPPLFPYTTLFRSPSALTPSPAPLLSPSSSLRTLMSARSSCVPPPVRTKNFGALNCQEKLLFKTEKNA